MSDALPVTARPFLHDPVSTSELPPTPVRTHRIPAAAWDEAPPELLALAADLETDEPPYYLRRVDRFLLWRAGPPVGEARYLAIAVDDLDEQYTFALHGKTGEGIGVHGQSHERFRTWKESLLP